MTQHNRSHSGHNQHPVVCHTAMPIRFYSARPRYVSTAVGVALNFSILYAITLILISSALVRKWIVWWNALICVLGTVLEGIAALDVAMARLPDMGPVSLALLSSHMVAMSVIFCCLIVAAIEAATKDNTR
jgi:hypothetical protein